MANGDYDRKDDRTTYYRVPDNGLCYFVYCFLRQITNKTTARHYITSKTSPSGKVEVIAHEKAIHDRDAPRASESRDDYAREEREWARKQQERARRERERQERKYHEESRR